MSAHEPQRHLLFGLLAFQNGMADRKQLLNAFSAWLADKSISIDQWLVANGILTEFNRDAIQRIVDQHIERFGTDLSQSIAGESNDTACLRRELEQLAATDADAKHAHTVISANAANHGNATNLSPPASEQALAETVHGPNETTDTPQHAGTTDQQRFCIIREHAKGGLGVVFVANDTQLRREVALKQIRSDRPDTEAFREKFTLEAEVTGQLEHPGIVPVYALGTDANGRPYYAMRLIKGEDLKSRITAFHKERKAKQQPLDGVELRKLLRRFVDVCNAMSYAHERGVLHRDLKPANVMLGKHGETLVVDWGLAKPIGQKASDTEGSFDATSSEVPLQPSGSGSGSETRYGTFIGTPAYAPPEQVLGQLDRMGPRSDVYSLGAMLYELLTGQAPVAGKSIDEIISKVIAGEIDRPCSVNTSVPAALEAICLKAMSVKPEHRYATVDAFRMDLEGWLDDQPVSAYPEPLVVRARRWTRNHPAMTTGISATTVLGLLAAVGFSIISAGHNTALVTKNDTISQQSQQLQKTSDDLKVTNEQILQQSKEFRLRTARNYLHSGVIAFDSGKQDEGIQTLLAAYVLSKEDPELHESVTRIAFDRATLGGRRLVPQIVQDSPARSMAYSGDGRLLFTGGEDGVVRIYDAMTTRISNSSSPVEVGPYISDSQVDTNFDGSRILFASTVWEVNTGQHIALEVPSKHQLRETHFSLDRELIYGILEDEADPPKRTLCQWDAGDGSYSRKLGDVSGLGYPFFQIHPNGRQLIFCNAYNWFVWDLHEGQMSTSGGRFLNPIPGSRVTISPDGMRISEGFRISDVITSNVIYEFSRDDFQSGMIKPHSFRPDGRELATTDIAVGRTSYEYSVNSFQASEVPYIHSQPLAGVCFSPDGCVRTYQEVRNRLDLHESTAWASENFRNPLLPQWSIARIIFNGDGSKYALSDKRTSRIYSTSSNMPVSPVIKHEFAWRIGLSRDGKRFAAAGTIWDTENATLISRFDARKDDRGVFYLADNNESVVTFDDKLGVPFAFSQSGASVLTERDKTLAVWDVHRRHRTAGPIPVEEGITTGILRSDLSYFVAGCVDGTVIIHYFDGSNREVRISNGAIVNDMDVSPDGKVLLTVNPQLNAWDTETGIQLYKTQAFRNDKYNAFAFTPEGHEVYFSTEQGTLRKWDFETPALPETFAVKKAFLELLTGFRVDEAGLTSRLSESDREERFVAIESEPDWWAQHLDFIKRKRLNWHRYQLSESIAENDHFGASFHLNQLRKKLHGDDEQLKSVVEPLQTKIDLNQQVTAAHNLAAESKWDEALAILDSLRERFPQQPAESFQTADELRIAVLLSKRDSESVELAGQWLLSPQHFQPGENRRWNLLFSAWLLQASDDQTASALAKYAELPEERRADVRWIEGWIRSARGESEQAVIIFEPYRPYGYLDYVTSYFLASALHKVDERAAAIVECKSAKVKLQYVVPDKSKLPWEEQFCVSAIEHDLDLLNKSLVPDNATEVLQIAADCLLRDRFAMAEGQLSQLESMPDVSPADRSLGQLLLALCSVHHVKASAGEESVLDAFRSLIKQTELKPSDAVWQAMLADMLIHASHDQHALMLSELNGWATDRGLAQDPHLLIARCWVEAALSSEAATIPEIDLNDPLNATSPVSRYFAARHLRLKGNLVAVTEQTAQALALLDQGWLSANPTPVSRFLEQQLRARLELLRSAHTVGFTCAVGVKTLPLGGLVADSVPLENTNASEKLAGWLSEDSEFAVLADRKLFAVKSQSPAERREMHDFGDAPNFGDLTVSPDGSFGWLQSNAVQRRQHGTSETKGSGFDPSYSDDGSTFVWSSWDKDGNYQFELDRGAENSAFSIPTHPTFSMYPSLSSDGRQIVFRSIGRDGTPQIGLLDTTTGETKQITDNGESNLKPCFSPDGRFVAFLQSHVSQNPSKGRIRLVVRDLQSGVETVVANDVQYVRAFWKPVAKD